MFAKRPSVARFSLCGSQRFFASAAQAAPAASASSFEVKTSTLKSGARVVTVQSDALSRGLALFVKAGSRYETRETAGVAQFAKHMVFQRSATRSPVFVVRDMESLTSEFVSSTTRDTLSFTARLEPNNVSAVQLFLADSLKPVFHEYIIGDLVPTIELESQLAEEDPNTIFTETLHKTAFRNTGLGRGLYCASNRASSISHTQVADFWADRVANPANHTWVGVGVDHDQIKDLVEGSGKSVEATPSHYYGGDVSVSLDTNTRVGIAFKGLAENDKDLPALAVLSAVTGGDARYSHDGPGRGVTTRLYRNVLQKHDGVVATATFNASYSDAGLWGVYAEAQPGNVPKVVELLTGELSKLKKEGLNASELEGAKNRAKAAFLRELDTPKGWLNYLGRKGSAPGTLLTPSEFVSKLDKLTAEDVSKVAHSVLSSDVTLVCVGDVEGLPLARDIQTKL